MLSVKRLVTSMRFRLGDMQGTRFSDYELIEAINRAASLLFARMGARFVWAAAKKTVVVVDEEAGSALIPRDFHSMRRVTREAEGDVDPGLEVKEYRIIGNEFYATPGAYGMEYYYIPRPVFNPDNELDAPEAVSPYLEMVALAIINNAPNGASQISDECCEALAGGEVSRFPEFGPVQILGGKL